MALLGQPAAARVATSCSAFDNVCQLDAVFAAGDGVPIDNVPPNQPDRPDPSQTSLNMIEPVSIPQCLNRSFNGPRRLTLH
jgi:hypothetical protein